jgi:hypothetical protein
MVEYRPDSPAVVSTRDDEQQGRSRLRGTQPVHPRGLRSTGTEPVTVKSLKLLNTNGFAISNVTVPQEIQPGNDLSVTVSLTATQPGSYQNRLFVEHSGVPGEGSDILLTGLVS